MQKILSLVPKLKLSKNQRLPITSQVHPGKWFLHLNASNILSLILAFPDSDENMVERFLSKTTNALNEAQLLLPDREKFITHLDEKVKKYGLHCLRDYSDLNSISKIEFSESIFQDSHISVKMNETMSPPTEIIKQIEEPDTEHEPELKSEVQTSSSPIETPITIVTKPNNNPTSTENFDFFEFDSTPETNPIQEPESTQIIISNGTSAPVPQSSIRPESNLKSSSSKPIRIRFARYALGLFSVLMFLILLKMFSELGSNTVRLTANHVRYSSSHHRHHQV